MGRGLRIPFEMLEPWFATLNWRRWLRDGATEDAARYILRVTR
jgi:hypothetical protein